MRKSAHDIKEERIAEYNKQIVHVRNTYHRETIPIIQYPLSYKKCSKCGSLVKLEKVYFISSSSLSSFAISYDDRYGCKDCFKTPKSFYDYLVENHYIPSEWEYVCNHANHGGEKAKDFYKENNDRDWEKMANDLISRCIKRLKE